MQPSTIASEKYLNIDRLMNIAKQMSLRKNKHFIIITYLQMAKEALLESDMDKADSLTYSAQRILFKEIPWTKKFYFELAHTK
jgi:hypothetical protein